MIEATAVTVKIGSGLIRHPAPPPIPRAGEPGDAVAAQRRHDRPLVAAQHGRAAFIETSKTGHRPRRRRCQHGQRQQVTRPGRSGTRRGRVQHAATAVPEPRRTYRRPPLSASVGMLPAGTATAPPRAAVELGAATP